MHSPGGKPPQLAHIEPITEFIEQSFTHPLV